MDMDDTNDGEAVPMTKEAVVDALKGELEAFVAKRKEQLPNALY